MDVAFSNQYWLISFLQSLLLSICYVGSLYIYPSPFRRDHPITIKQRIKSVLIVCLLAPIYLYLCSTEEGVKYPLWEWIGFRTKGFFSSLFLTLFLTVILFTGPLVQVIITGGFKEFLKEIFTLNHFKNWNFYRVAVVAPFTEEFIFRACLIPLLKKSFDYKTIIVLAPLFFGVAHLHHILEQLGSGTPVFEAFLVSLFQMVYTTVFGIYSAYLYIKTGHLIGIVACHSFCNLMGFPDFLGIFSSRYPKIVLFTYIIGLVLFINLLYVFNNSEFLRSFIWSSDINIYYGDSFL
ncbi:CAAX prenyl protease 2 [Hydra vulgaris]|uniref:CAAX prenyl protease 2 n=1 Tax=Hydra vulgaris TaxID=6087 RepID=A0ABM4D647_HYDVU